MISILLSTYNGATYIEEQLESLRTQSRPADEVIICDDCSTDKTVKIISDYIKRHELSNSWLLIANKTNRGWKRNFFENISLTNGDYIFFCDQDDIWCKRKIEIMMKIFDMNPKYNVIATNERLWISKPITDKEMSFLNRKIRDTYETLELDKNGLTYFINSSGCCMAFKKTYYMKIKNYFFSEWAHDDFFWKLALVDGTLAKMDDATILHRITGKNESRKKRNRQNSIKGCENSIFINNNVLNYINSNKKNINNYKEKIAIITHKNKMEIEKRKLLQNKNIISFFKLLLFGMDTYRKKSQLFKDLVMSFININARRVYEND